MQVSILKYLEMVHLSTESSGFSEFHLHNSWSFRYNAEVQCAHWLLLLYRGSEHLAFSSEEVKKKREISRQID